MLEPVIQFDYDFSPYGTKTKLLLAANGVDFSKSAQPVVLPRPDLEELGITYRRIPLLAIGKDIYADSALIIDVIQSRWGKIPTSTADKAYEQWGNAVFQEVLGTIPSAVMTPEFIKDREPIFPLLTRPDFLSLRPSSLAGFKARLREAEDGFLATSRGPFLTGDKISLADIHFIWPIKFAFHNLGVDREPGFGKEAFPKVWKLLDNLPSFSPKVLNADETRSLIHGALDAASGPKVVAKDDPTGFTAGTQVSVESFDTTPGKHPQLGKLVAADENEVVLEIKDGLHLHFPRIGYIVRAQ